MFNTSLPNSLPKPGACLNLNILPEYFQRNDVYVELADGTREKTCHIVADGRVFNFRTAFDTLEEWKYIYIREFSYLDHEGETQIVKVSPRNPHLIEKGYGDTICGYVTNINDKRWGVTMSLNWITGQTSIINDVGSPIVGVLFQFIE